MSRVLRVEHLARVEGHGGITVEIDGAEIKQVRFDVLEGMRLVEGLVRGHHWSEVSQIVSRICSICSTAHALTSICATEAAFGVQPSPRTELLRDLLWRGENIASHALHLFLLAAPDYLGYPSGPAMAADHPGPVGVGLRLKKLGNRMQELFGGRAIHPVAAIPGGFAHVPSADALIALAADLDAARRDVEAAIEFVRTLPPADLAVGGVGFAALAPRPGTGYGYGPGDQVAFLVDGRRETVPAKKLFEHVGEKAVPHSHAKHSFHRGRPFMVGALARLNLFGSWLEPRARDAAATLGLRFPSENPMDNNLAQMVELVHDVEVAGRAVDTLLAQGAAAEPPVAVVARAGVGTAVTEAPRGLLLHRYGYDADGRVTTAEVITPTAFNAASVEDRFAKLLTTEAGKNDQALTLELEMIARAYDPCISCSVHLVRRTSAS